MMLRLLAISTLALAACTTAASTDRAGSATVATTSPASVVPNRIFELRTYTAPDGKLPELEARFRKHTARLFERHGMTNVGYWIPTDSALSKNTIIYILAYPSRDAARASWSAFGRDPDWQKVRRESEANGPIVTRVTSVFMSPTDFSAIR